MKKIVYKILFILAAVVLFASCETKYIMFDSSKNFVAFTGKSVDIPEPGSRMGIPVLVTALPDSPPVTVTFEFNTGDLGDKAAVEGTDFTLVNDSKTLSFPDGYGYDTIWIQPVDNDEFTGNKAFYIELLSNSVDYQFGLNTLFTVNLIDDEHPLKDWIGTYDVYAYSYGSPGAWDEQWSCVTSADPSDVNNLLLSGIGGSSYPGTPVVAKVDLETMTLTIAGGSEIGSHSAYGGPVAIFLGDESGGVASESDPIVGEIREDGSIHIDHLALKFVGGINAGYIWDSFDTEWTKTGKKSFVEKSVPEEKAARFK
jgi:hypothetical protein